MSKPIIIQHLDNNDVHITNTNIIGSTKTKITYDSKGLVTLGEDATTSDIADTLDKRYVTDKHLDILNTYKKPRLVIWDTDFFTDVDDVGAARILLWAERQGLIDIVAVCGNVGREEIPPALDALFQFHGREVVLGFDKSATAADALKYQQNMALNQHSVGCLAMTDDAVKVYRRAFANATEPIDIIAVGFLNNISNFLQSPADSISSLTGMQLMQQNGGKLWCMGGVYPSGTEYNFFATAFAKAGSYYTVTNFPNDIIFLDFNVGSTIKTGDTLATVLGTADDIVAKAYTDYGASTGRESWDPMLTLIACLGDTKLAGYSTIRGTNTINQSTGANSFSTNSTGKHYYVQKDKTDNWYKREMNTILERIAWSSRNGLGNRSLKKIATNYTLTNITDNANLVGCWNTDDLVANDGDLIGTLPNKTGTNDFTNNTTGEKPMYVKNKNGHTALYFKSSRMFSPLMASSNPITIYAKVLFEVIPTSRQLIIQHEGATHVWHLKVDGTGVASALWPANVPTDITTTNKPFRDTWHILTMTISGLVMNMYLDGVNIKTYTASSAYNTTSSENLVIGANNFNNNEFSEKLNGYIHELRIYNVAHDATTRNNVINQMSLL